MYDISHTNDHAGCWGDNPHSPLVVFRLEADFDCSQDNYFNALVSPGQ